VVTNVLVDINLFLPTSYLVKTNSMVDTCHFWNAHGGVGLD
jgi:hypothetical protein